MEMPQLSLSGVIMALLLLLGIFLTIRHGFFQLRGASFIWKHTLGTLFKKETAVQKGISPFQAMTTALAGTMGVGNIAGVATALIAGGPGAIFWMWVSAFFGMMTKYTEIFLAVRYRITDKQGQFSGGPMYYMKNALKKPWLAGMFSVLCALCSLGIGNMTQVNAVSTAMQDTFAVPHWVSGVVVTVLVGLVVFGGVKRIATVTEWVIPIISVVYIFCAGTLLWQLRAMLPQTFAQIVQGAFGLRQAAGGALGYGLANALRFGLARGVFTNEAGLGSAPIVHAAANCKSPAHQGAWGIFEVFLDTSVVCTITALVLLCAGGGILWQSGLDGAVLTSAAFESGFAGFGSKFITLSILFFAVSAMLGWCYYGQQALAFLFNNNQTVINGYRVLFLACILPGAVGGISFVWGISDLLNAFMALPNILAILGLRKVVFTPKNDS